MPHGARESGTTPTARCRFHWIEETPSPTWSISGIGRSPRQSLLVPLFLQKIKNYFSFFRCIVWRQKVRHEGMWNILSVSKQKYATCVLGRGHHLVTILVPPSIKRLSSFEMPPLYSLVAFFKVLPPVLRGDIVSVPIEGDKIIDRNRFTMEIAAYPVAWRTSFDLNSAFLKIVEWKAPGQKRLGNSKCLKSWLWMKRNCQLMGNGTDESSESGTAGSMSNRISNSGGRSGLATTAVGMTSICGMRIFPDSMALMMSNIYRAAHVSCWFVHVSGNTIFYQAKTFYLLDNIFLCHTTPLWPIRSNAQNFYMGSILRS